MKERNAKTNERKSTKPIKAARKNEIEVFDIVRVLKDDEYLRIKCYGFFESSGGCGVRDIKYIQKKHRNKDLKGKGQFKDYRGVVTRIHTETFQESYSGDGGATCSVFSVEKVIYTVRVPIKLKKESTTPD